MLQSDGSFWPSLFLLAEDFTFFGTETQAKKIICALLWVLKFTIPLYCYTLFSQKLEKLTPLCYSQVMWHFCDILHSMWPHRNTFFQHHKTNWTYLTWITRFKRIPVLALWRTWEIPAEPYFIVLWCSSCLSQHTKLQLHQCTGIDNTKFSGLILPWICRS